MKEYKDNWYQVRYDGQVGYVKGGYFATDSGTTSAADSGSTSSSSSSSWSMKTTANLRLRASRSTSGSIMDVIPKNTKVTVLNEYDGWYKVKNTGNVAELDWVVEGGKVAKKDGEYRVRAKFDNEATPHSVTACGRYKNGVEFRVKCN